MEGVEAGVEGGEARGMGAGGVAGRLFLGMRDSTARRKSSRGSDVNVSNWKGKKESMTLIRSLIYSLTHT